jgi:hypothetical protein
MSWKKVVVSGSNAHLETLGVGTAAAPSTAGHISASGKLFTETADSSGGLSSFDVVIKGANGEFMHTASSAINPTLQNLTISTGLLPSSTDYNGSAQTTISVDSASLAGDGITAKADGTGFSLDVGNNLTLDSSGVRVKTGSLAGFGLTADPAFTSGSVALGTGKIAVNVDGTTIDFNGSGELTVLGGTAANALTDGNGIQDFEYDGSTGATVIVDTGSLAGTGLTGTSGQNGYTQDKISIRGTFAGTDKVLKWTGTEFDETTISDNGSDAISLGGSGYTVTVPGNLTVAGTASFTNASNVSTADDFFLLNSGSGTAENFGIIGQTNLAGTEGIGWSWNSTNKRWGMYKDMDTTSGGALGSDKVGDAPLLLAQTVVASATNTDYEAKNGNMLIDGDGNIYMYF